MDLLKAIEERRSTRGFLDKPVGRDTLETLLQLATQAPSAINLQPWEFAVVSGEERKRLGRVLVKRMREKNISCGPGATRPLPEYFVERERGLLNVMLPHLPEQKSFQDFINEGSCNFYGAPTAIIITIDLSVIFRLDFSISPYCAVFNAARCYGQDTFFHLLCTD
jgi:nitroreductase